jgi:hypothetical protein
MLGLPPLPDLVSLARAMLDDFETEATILEALGQLDPSPGAALRALDQARSRSEAGAPPPMAPGGLVEPPSREAFPLLHASPSLSTTPDSPSAVGSPPEVITPAERTPRRDTEAPPLPSTSDTSEERPGAALMRRTREATRSTPREGRPSAPDPESPGLVPGASAVGPLVAPSETQSGSTSQAGRPSGADALGVCPLLCRGSADLGSRADHADEKESGL